MWRELAQFEKVNYSKLQQRNSLVDLPQPTVQMTIEEAVPVDDAEPEISHWDDIVLPSLKLSESAREFAEQLVISSTDVDEVNFGFKEPHDYLVECDEAIILFGKSVTP